MLILSGNIKYIILYSILVKTDRVVSLKKRSRFFLKIVFVWIFVFFSFSIVQSQDTINDRNKGIAHVQWIKQFPSTETNKTKQGFTKRIAHIIFGKKPHSINKPFNILAESFETFWILDQGNGSIIYIDQNSVKTPRFLNIELMGFTSLVGICSFRNNKILFTDSHLHNIYLIDPAKKELISLNDSLSLKQPTGIAYSAINNEIWVVETGAHSIAVLNTKGEIKKRIGHRGNGNGEFNFPTFIWIDQLGNVYVVDSMNFRVQIFDKDGNFVSTFGKMGDATGYFARPKGIATDTFGNIYIADALFHVVQIFDKHGNFLYKFGEQGHEKGQFWMPTGIFIDDKDFIYVADSYNSRIQVFQLIKAD